MEIVTPVMVVDRMMEILAKPEAWMKGASAVDASGNFCSSKSREAVCFCVYGAEDKAVADTNASRAVLSVVTDALRDECWQRFNEAPAMYNDLERTTHADILGYLKAVRARLEATCTA